MENAPTPFSLHRSIEKERIDRSQYAPSSNKKGVKKEVFTYLGEILSALRDRALKQAQHPSARNGLSAICCPKFTQNIAHVFFDRGLRNNQALSQGLIRGSVGQQT